MSSTRHAPQGSAVSYERYMSSPAYAELRGIPGTAVAAKAQLYADTRKRSLVFFLQGLSTKGGGLRCAAQALLKKFPTHSEDELTDLFIEFCINPRVVIQFFDEPQAKNSSSVPSDTEMADALREFQDRYECDVRS